MEASAREVLRRDHTSVVTPSRFSLTDRMARPTLDCVDEEKEHEPRRARRVEAVRGDGELWSYLQSDVSSSEETENLYRQPSAMRRRTHVPLTKASFDRRSKRNTRGLHAAVQPPLLSSSQKHTRFRQSCWVGCGVPTLDEREQKKLVALFYWRRRTLEACFAVWKALPLHSKWRRGRQRQLPLSRDYHLPERMAASETRHHHSSVLLRNTLERQRSDSVTDAVGHLGHRARIDALRGEYRELKENGGVVAEIEVTRKFVPEVDPVKQTDLKVRLCLYYLYFESWRDYLSKSKEEEARKLEKALSLLRTRRLRMFFRLWCRDFLEKCRRSHYLYRHARNHRDTCTKHRYFSVWCRWFELQNTLKARSKGLGQVKTKRAVLVWRIWTARTVHLKYAAPMRRHLILTRYLSRLKRYIAIRREAKVAQRCAILTHNRQLTLRVWRQWTKVAFDNDLTRQYLRARRLLSHKFAVRRWRIFFTRRRDCSGRALQADCCFYEGLLRRYWHRWLQYFSFQIMKLSALDKAEVQRATYSKRQALRALLAHRCAGKFERDRDIGARSFYKRRCLGRFFSVWNTKVVRSQRCRKLQIARVERICSVFFFSWCRYARAIKHLNHTAFIVETSFRARLLRASIRTWNHLRIVRSAFRVVAKKRIARQHLQVFLAWRDITSGLHYRRISVKRLIVQRVRSKRVRVIMAWCHYTRESRCRRHLIRLFQKKLLFKQIRRCVQVLRHHAQVQQFLSSKNRHTIESAWHAWVIFKNDERERARVMAVAIEYHTARSFTLALHVWRNRAKRLVCQRGANSKAIAWRIQKIMRSTLHLWYLSARSSKRKQDFFKSHSANRQKVALLRCLHGWQRYAHVRIQQRHRIRRVWCRGMIQVRRRAFLTWAMYYNNRKRYNLLLDTAKRTLEHQRTRRFLHAWQAVASQLRGSRVAMSAIASTRRLRVLCHAVSEWSRIARDLRRARFNKLNAISFHREFLLLWAFYGWQHAALDYQLHRQNLVRAYKAISRIRLRYAVIKWRDRKRLRQGQMNFVIRGSKFHTRRSYQKGIRMLIKYAVFRRCRRASLRQARHFEAVNLLRRVFRSWLKFSSYKREFKLKLRAVFEAGANDVLLRSFRCWKRYKRKSSLTATAIRWRTKSLLQWIWSHWWAHIIFTRRMRSNVLITNRLLQSNATRTRFEQWKSYVERRQSRAQAIQDCDNYYSRRCYKITVHALRDGVRHARAVDLAETFHSMRLLRWSFACLARGSAKQKRWRERNKLVIALSISSRLKCVFYAWRDLLRAKQVFLEARAARYHGKLVVKRVWAAWWRVIARRRLVDKAIFGLLQKTLLNTFHAWKQTTREQQQIRRHVEAAVAHVDRAMKQKFWDGWVRYCDKRRASHRLEHVANFYYSTSILLRGSLSAWRKYVRDRHVYHTQKLAAEVFLIALIVRKCFVHLAGYVAHRRRRNMKKAAEEKLINQAKTKRTLHHWHLRVSTSRLLKDSIARAANVHKTHILTIAVELLVRYKTTKKLKRDQDCQASAFRKHHTFTQCFLQWTRFHRWRGRHKNLLRLFRSNQLNDYFALWKRYVLRSHKNRAQQNLAVRTYYNLIERRILVHWRMRCRHWRHKRLALQWRCEKTRRSALDVWAHRVRVLRKMRSMFRFQDSYRLETHFQAWKRRWSRKKQQLICLRDALTWFSRHRQAKCFALWSCWIDGKRKEKQTLHMALGFRKRFFSRKYLSAWRAVVTWQRRKDVLKIAARAHSNRTLCKAVISQLVAYTEIKKQNRVKGVNVEKKLAALHVDRAIFLWKRLVDVRRLNRNHVILAAQHLRIKLQQRCWAQLKSWLARLQVSRARLQRAGVHHREMVCRSAIAMWSTHIRERKLQTEKLQLFKDQFFRNITDDYFSRFKAFAGFKKRIRALKHRAERSQQLNFLIKWRHLALGRRKLRAALGQLEAIRGVRLLHRCLDHWESVVTDRWIRANLLLVAHQRRHRRICLHVLEQWKSSYTLWRAKRCWRARAFVRHAQRLTKVLREWRSFCGDGTGITLSRSDEA